MKKAVIVGLGIVCKIGIGKDECIKNILSNNIDLKEISKFPITGCDVKFVGEVDDSRIKYLNEEKERLVDRTSAYLLTALDEAIAEAKIDFTKFAKERVGIVIGTSLAGTEQAEEFYKQYKRQESKINIKNLLQYPLYTCADIISNRYSIHGPKVIISTACSSSATAIGYASDLIKLGIVDVVITGGGDPLDELSYAGFYSLGNMSKEKSSPFSKNSFGLSLGEGAAVFILTEKQIAILNKNDIYGEVKGYGIGADAYHPTAPDPQGKAACYAIEKAIDFGGLHNKLDEIEYINAHGTGTTHNDMFETSIIKKVFSEELAKKVYISSTKSMTGHTLGAAGSIEIALSCLGMRYDFLPPTINFTESRVGCDLNYIPNKALKKHKITNFLSNSFGFGGNNVSVLVGKSDENKDEEDTIGDKCFVITGIGCVSSLGNSLEKISSAVFAGKTGIFTESEEIIGFCRNKATKSARVKDFNLNSINRFKNARRMDRISQLAVGASFLALKHAKFIITPKNDRDIGLIYGTGTGPIETLTRFYDPIVEKGLSAGKSSLFANTVANAAAGYIGIENKIKGYSTTITNGYTSGLLSLVMGCNFLSREYCKQILVGSADEYSLPLHQGLLSIGAISQSGKNGKESMLPMGEERNGLILGEGANFLLVESKSTAISSNRKIYGEIAGFGVSSDICEISKNDPQGRGMELAINTALKSAKISKNDINLVFASASGLLMRDKSEGVGIKRALGDVPVFMISPYVGDTTGSIGLFSLSLGLVSFEKNIIPSIKKKYSIDPEIGINVLMGPPLEKKINNFLVTANSFGGLNVAVIVKRNIE